MDFGRLSFYFPNDLLIIMNVSLSTYEGKRVIQSLYTAEQNA